MTRPSKTWVLSLLVDIPYRPFPLPSQLRGLTVISTLALTTATSCGLSFASSVFPSRKISRDASKAPNYYSHSSDGYSFFEVTLCILRFGTISWLKWKQISQKQKVVRSEIFKITSLTKRMASCDSYTLYRQAPATWQTYVLRVK